MKQVVVIHGGTTFSDYDKYLDYLRTKALKIERLIYTPKWKDCLQTDLGNEYQVLMPSMPNSTNAQYGEWKLWFDRITDVVDDNCIFIGHSLGAVFLVKYLSENSLTKKITATILVAAPFDDETIEDLSDFKIKRVNDTFKKQAGQVIFFNGIDDPVIPTIELEKYKDELPDAEFHIMSAPDHFVRPQFPELIASIRSVT